MVHDDSGPLVRKCTQTMSKNRLPAIAGIRGFDRPIMRVENTQ
jgi:hypothetical protein